jgi:hypothetical protein
MPFTGKTLEMIGYYLGGIILNILFWIIVAGMQGFCQAVDEEGMRIYRSLMVEPRFFSRRSANKPKVISSWGAKWLNRAQSQQNRPSEQEVNSARKAAPELIKRLPH